MSLLSYFTIVGALGVVLILVGLAMAAIRRFTGISRGSRARIPMEIVQRLPLGPKQGIAVVRIGQRVVAVSVGEGGIRPVMEVAEDDRLAVLASAPAVARIGDVAVEAGDVEAGGTGGRGELEERWALGASGGRFALPGRRDFGAALRTALRSYMTIALVLAGGAVLADAVATTPVFAQVAAGGFGATPGIAQPGANPEAAAQADSIIARLAPEIDLRLGNSEEGGLRLSGTVGVVVMMGLLTLLPTLLLMMTSFTRILVVLHFLRQALGTQSAPPAHLMAALALLLTGFVMAPTLTQVNSTALQPWMNGEIEQAEMFSVGSQPFREFMLAQTRDRDLSTFMEMRDDDSVATTDDIPFVVVVSAFVTSELRTAFQIGFALFLPFIVIDVVVAAVLMSMGMFMLPPAMISLPFKLLLFVLVDGWSLIVQGLVTSFR